MNILHVTQSLDPSWGGIARVLPMLAGELATAGDTCRIAVLHGDRFGDAPDVPGVEVLRFHPKKKSRLGRSADFDKRIGELLPSADVLHLHGLWTGQNWSAARAARKIGHPFIITPHSMMMPWAWQRSAWKKRLVGRLFEHKNLRTAACLHALAEGEAAHIRDLGFNTNVKVIPNGLHPDEFESLPPADDLEERFESAKDQRWVLFLGRIAEQKGIVPGMLACFDVMAAHSDWHLVIAGPDEFGMRQTLEAAVGRKGMADRVTFTGTLERQEVLACLGRSSILLQPSLSEGLSMTIIEAMAARLPVLISNACNMPEVAEQRAGCVVEPERRSIAAALRELIGLSDDERRAMGDRGREMAKARFDWAGLIPKYRQMYANVVGGSAAS